MTQQLIFPIVVHAQEGFTYTNHPSVGNIGEYVDPNKPSLNLIEPSYGEPLFPTKYFTKAGEDGYFNPEDINGLLELEEFDSEEKLDLEIILLGGELYRCMRESFRIISQWESKTHFLNRTTVRIPHNGAFDLNRHGDKKPLFLEDMVKKQGFVMSFCMEYCFYWGLDGQLNFLDKEIEFKFKKRPWGAFLEGEMFHPYEMSGSYAMP